MSRFVRTYFGRRLTKYLPTKIATIYTTASGGLVSTKPAVTIVAWIDIGLMVPFGAVTLLYFIDSRIRPDVSLLKGVVMRIALFCALILGMGPSAVIYAQDATRDSVQFRYRYSEGDRLRYRIDFRHGIVDTSNGNTTRGSLKHGFQYLREVQSVNSDTGTASLTVTFEQANFDAGAPGGGFDSTNAEQRSRAKTNPQWQVWGALLSSTARMRVTPLGQIEFFRLTDMDKGYDDRVRDSVNRVLEENSQYLAAPLPSANVAKGSSWTGNIPVRLLGGALRGNVIFVEGKYTFDHIEQVKGETFARINLSLNKQPNLGVTGESIKGAEADFSVQALNGTLLFSLDKGNIAEYDVVVKTHLTLAVDKQVVDDHAMEYEFNLKRVD